MASGSSPSYAETKKIRVNFKLPYKNTRTQIEDNKWLFWLRNKLTTLVKRNTQENLQYDDRLTGNRTYVVWL